MQEQPIQAQTPLLHRFLRLFNLYRDLEQAYTQSVEYSNALETERSQGAHARIKAEDDARFWKSRADIAIEELRKARDEALNSVKKIANFEALRTGLYIVPFPEVYSPPPPPEPTEGDENAPQHPNTARARQLAAVAQSRKDAAERRRKFRESLDLGEPVESALKPEPN